MIRGTEADEDSIFVRKICEKEGIFYKEIKEDVPALAKENGLSEEEAGRILSEDEVTVIIDMHTGNAEATAWGCDLSYDYVKINADYRS